MNTLGNDQPELLTFTNHHDQPIGDNDEMDNATPNEEDDALLPGVDHMIGNAVKITGVDDMETPMTENTETPMTMTPPEVEILDLGDFNIPDPAPIERVEAPDELAIPITVPAPVLDPEIPGLCHSMRVRTQTKRYKQAWQAQDMPMPSPSWRAKECSIQMRTCSCNKISTKPSLMLW